MRYVERTSMARVPMKAAARRRRRRCHALAVLARLQAASDCAFRATRPTRRPPLPSSQAATAGAAASAPPTAARPTPRPVSTGPIGPATQRAYDDALAALHANRTADAERGFRALVQSDPDLAGPHANLGLIARQAGRLPEAVSELERATDLDAGQPVIWNQLGITYRQSGQFAKARTAYDNALAIDPAYATAVLNLGVLNDLYLGDSARALELYGALSFVLDTLRARHDGRQVGRRPEEPQADGRSRVGSRVRPRGRDQGEIMTRTGPPAFAPSSLAARSWRSQARWRSRFCRSRRSRSIGDHRQPRIAEGALHRAVEEAAAGRPRRPPAGQRDRRGAGADRSRRLPTQVHYDAVEQAKAAAAAAPRPAEAAAAH